MGSSVRLFGGFVNAGWRTARAKVAMRCALRTQARRSKRSRFITLVQAATKSRTNFSAPSVLA